MIQLRPNGYCNYRSDVSSMLGRIKGPSMDGIRHLAITAENGGRRIGFFALDSQDALDAANQWLEENGHLEGIEKPS